MSPLKVDFIGSFYRNFAKCPRWAKVTLIPAQKLNYKIFVVQKTNSNAMTNIANRLIADATMPNSARAPLWEAFYFYDGNVKTASAKLTGALE
ncbi:MAG: hypothetical protein EKE20_13820 [Candidatus Symbiopectobacterium sp. Dall1.0]|nr:hypothetical protein [Candidatus Symbiopectobacterium sp. Dall1.0]